MDRGTWQATVHGITKSQNIYSYYQMYLFNNIVNKFWHIYGLHVRYSNVLFIIENSSYRKHTYIQFLFNQKYSEPQHTKRYI